MFLAIWRRPLGRLGVAILLGGVAGALCGISIALFLWLLDAATGWRDAQTAIVWALPLAGLAIGAFWERHGGPIRGGTGLIIDTLHDGGPPVPLRMTPMVLFGSVLTHLFGGSAGREGAAVQMGASLSDQVAVRFGLSASWRRQMLAAGAAGGFGAVFGTPIAGLLFGLEFASVGRLDARAALPALVAAVVGDRITLALGVVHTPYSAAPSLAIDAALVGKWALFAIAVALTAATFIELTHALKRHGERWFPRLPVRMAVGGALVVLLWQLSGTNDFLGLGLPTILRAFHDPALPEWTFAAKIVFTAVTIGAGFLGGEVTPLFFIGAALGNALADPLGLPLPLAAGVGLAAMFAAASNTPVALTVMAVELFGAHVLPHVALVAFLATALTGPRSIYMAQRRLHLERIEWSFSLRKRSDRLSKRSGR